MKFEVLSKGVEWIKLLPAERSVKSLEAKTIIFVFGFESARGCSNFCYLLMAVIPLEVYVYGFEIAIDFRVLSTILVTSFNGYYIL